MRCRLQLQQKITKSIILRVDLFSTSVHIKIQHVEGKKQIYGYLQSAVEEVNS